ncbi:unnamed protein product, partial [Meganyctiphanes norvegica]
MHAVFYVTVASSGAICLLTVILVSQIHSAWSVPGEYRCLDVNKDRWITSELADEKYDVYDATACEEFCGKNAVCTGFAYSKSRYICLLYEIKIPSQVQENVGYDLYIKMRSKADGYHIWDTSYIRLMLKRKSHEEARSDCVIQRGNLVTIKDISDSGDDKEKKAKYLNNKLLLDLMVK